MKESITHFFFVTAVVIAGTFLSFISFISKHVCRLRHLSACHYTILVAGLSIFLIGFGLLSLLGSEPFALPVIVVGLVALLLSLAKQIITLSRVGLILILDAARK